ncbi:MAG: tetratricopeptide repeat protein [Gammaproteobacteria bacterium]|nr:tetratricopeptide repeat protein [Gammaproteobacteria bacterium]
MNIQHKNRRKNCLLALLLGVTAFASNPALADISGGQAAILKGNFAKAFTEFKEDAEKGIPEAQAAVAVMLHIGQGVKRDLPGALSWYRKAAEKGYEAGVANVGIMYYKGAGVAQNDVQAYAWLDLASHMRGGREHNAKARVASFLSEKQLKEAQKLAADYRQKYLKK